jgi:Flp pilus assembly protein TadG
MKSRNRGTTSVEFAIVGLSFFIVLFGIIEVARFAFMWNSLAEATRRGARLAAVCNAAAAGTVQSVAVFGTGAPGASSLMPGLSDANVTVTYGAAPVLPETTQFVTVAITGYTFQLNIPLLNLSLPAPAFTTTLPTESLGNLAPGVGCPIP